LGADRAPYAEPGTLANKTSSWLSVIRRRPLPDRVTFLRSKPALCIIDMQNYFCSREGRAYLPSSEAIIPNLDNLRKAFIDAGLPVVFTQHGHKNSDAKHPLLRWWSQDIVIGTTEFELDPRLHPSEGSYIVGKDQYSAFRSDKFCRFVNKKGIGALVIAGVMTNLCCESTSRDAFMENMDVYLLADGTATVSEEMHVGTLRSIAYGFGYVATCEEMKACLK